MGMSLFALTSRSLSSSMNQPLSDWPAFTPSTTTTPTPSPSSCTTKWIIALPYRKKSNEKILRQTFSHRRARPACARRLGGGAVFSAPFPGWNPIRLAPQPEPAFARVALRGIEALLRLVQARNPRHAAPHLLGVDIDVLAGHARENAAVAILLLPGEACHLVRAQVCER